MAERITVLVLGASGMLGSAVLRMLSEADCWRVDGTQNGNPSGPDYLDIMEMSREQWTSVLVRRRYDYIVNCIGILKPAVNERDAQAVSRAIRVNALFPHELASLTPEAKILHLSTDGMFSGISGRPYVETDPADCQDVYGKTKALGECPADNVINFRCSIIGRDKSGGKGLIEWVLRTPEGAELTGFGDQHWNGVTTGQFAELCRRIILSGRFEEIRHSSGTYHFCPNPATTKYELLCRIRDAAGLRISIRHGTSAGASARILASLYSNLKEIYSESRGWDALISDALSTV